MENRKKHVLNHLKPYIFGATVLREDDRKSITIQLFSDRLIPSTCFVGHAVIMDRQCMLSSWAVSTCCHRGQLVHAVIVDRQYMLSSRRLVHAVIVDRLYMLSSWTACTCCHHGPLVHAVIVNRQCMLSSWRLVPHETRRRI